MSPVTTNNEGAISGLTLIGAGILVGVVSGLLGVGGGVVLVPILVFLLHYQQKNAQATSLAAIGVDSIDDRFPQSWAESAGHAGSASVR